jgi:hypothetical protein
MHALADERVKLVNCSTRSAHHRNCSHFSHDGPGSDVQLDMNFHKTLGGIFNVNECWEYRGLLSLFLVIGGALARRRAPCD